MTNKVQPDQLFDAILEYKANNEHHNSFSDKNIICIDSKNNLDSHSSLSINIPSTSSHPLVPPPKARMYSQQLHEELYGWSDEKFLAEHYAAEISANRKRLVEQSVDMRRTYAEAASIPSSTISSLEMLTTTASTESSYSSGQGNLSHPAGPSSSPSVLSLLIERLSTRRGCSVVPDM